MKNLITLLFAFTCTFCSAQKVKLALNLKQDSTYYLKTNAEVTIDQEINGKHQTVVTNINASVSHKVIAIRDTVYEMELRYQSMSMGFKVGDKTMNFNSDTTKGGDILSKLINSMLNKPFIMVISKSGLVLGMKNMDNLYAGMFDAFPKITEAQKAQFKNQMQQSFGESSIKNNMQDAFIIFTKKAISINDSWVTHTVLQASAISVKTSMTYVLEGVTGNTYLISGNAVVNSDKEPPYNEKNGMQLRIADVSGQVTANLKLNKTTGWITESKVEKHIKGVVQIKDGPNVPGGMTYPMVITGNLTVTGQ